MQLRFIVDSCRFRAVILVSAEIARFHGDTLFDFWERTNHPVACVSCMHSTHEGKHTDHSRLHRPTLQGLKQAEFGRWSLRKIKVRLETSQRLASLASQKDWRRCLGLAHKMTCFAYWAVDLG